jgi:hypothetical protein
VQTKCPCYWSCDQLSGLVSVPIQFDLIVDIRSFFNLLCFHGVFIVTCDAVTRTSWGRCDLLSLILPYFGSLYYPHHCPRRSVENWRLPLFFQPDLITQQSSQSPSSSRHRPPGPPPSPGRAASHPLREQMDVVAADAFAAFLIALYFIIVCCFTDKFIRRTTRLSFSWPFG